MLRPCAQAGNEASLTSPNKPEADEGPSLLLRLALWVTAAAVGLPVLMLTAFALPALLEGSAGGPFTLVWAPDQEKFGIVPMLAGSALLALGALPLGWLMALGVTCQLLTRPRAPLTKVLRPVIRIMTAVPTVVYGFAAVFLLTPLVRNLAGGSGFSWITACAMLTLLVLPTMILVMEAGLRPRHEALEPSGSALGFSSTQLFILFVLPQSRGALTSAAVLGFGRAVGDTLLPLMLAGNAVHIPDHPAEALRALTAHMALVTANEAGSAAYDSLFTAGLLLLAVNACLSLTLRRLQGRGVKHCDAPPAGALA